MAPTASSLPNVWIPYITIQMAQINLAWSALDGKPDYFISISHKKQENQANTMTISIDFAPSYRQDVSMIEHAIVESKGEAIVTYGYIRGWTNKYKILINNCIPQINNGVLSYQLSAISQSVVYNFTAVSEPAIKEASEVLPTMQLIVDKYCKDHNGGPAYIFDGGDSDFNIPKDGIVITGRSPIRVLQIISQALVAIGDEEKKTYRYFIEIDDAYGLSPGHIRLRKVDMNKSNQSFTFEWGTKTGTVLSWAPQWNMNIAIFASRQKAGQKDSEYQSQVNVEQTQIATAVSSVGTQLQENLTSKDGASFNPAEPLALANTAITAQDNWVKYAEYGYQGTLKVIGEVKNMSIGNSIIEINPYVNGQLHHSAGKYIVTGVQDDVSASGFTTTYTVYRQVGDDTPYSTSYGESGDQNNYIFVDGQPVPYSMYDPYDNIGDA